MNTASTHHYRLSDSQGMPVLLRAIQLAEELVGDHYRLSSMEGDLGHFDVLTQSEHAMEPNQKGGMAEVVLCSRLEAIPSWSERPPSFFRIHLYDQQIQEAAQRLGEQGGDLFDLLLYVLVHELIHVVRFRRFLGRFHAAPPAIGQEEERVEEETAAVLRKVNTPGIRVLLREWEEGRLERKMNGGAVVAGSSS